MLQGLKAAKQNFDFSRYGHLQQLVLERQEGMACFLKDYEEGMEQGRYVGLDSIKKNKR